MCAWDAGGQAGPVIWPVYWSARAANLQFVNRTERGNGHGHLATVRAATSVLSPFLKITPHAIWLGPSQQRPVNTAFFLQYFSLKDKSLEVLGV
jgi:hypothetical protein